MPMTRRTSESPANARNTPPTARPTITAGIIRTSVGQCAWRR